MSVRVLLFAALREAAGTGETAVEAGALPGVLEVLSARYGERFARVLKISAVLLDGTQVARDAEIQVPDGSELALLPPVSGGVTPDESRLAARRRPLRLYQQLEAAARQAGASGEAEWGNQTMDLPLPPPPSPSDLDDLETDHGAAEWRGRPLDGADRTARGHGSAAPWQRRPGEHKRLAGEEQPDGRAHDVGWSLRDHSPWERPLAPGGGRKEEPRGHPRQAPIDLPPAKRGGAQTPDGGSLAASAPPSPAAGHGPAAMLGETGGPPRAGSAAAASGEGEVRTAQLAMTPEDQQTVALPADHDAPAEASLPESGTVETERSGLRRRGRDRLTMRGGLFRERMAQAVRLLPKDPVAAAALPVGLALAGWIGLLAGRDAFAFAVLVGSALALVDLVVLIDRGIARPLLPVVVIPGLALPAMLAFNTNLGPGTMVSAVAVSVIAGFGLMLLAGRRWGVGDGIGLTLTAGLVIGLGASGLILLRDLPGGFRTVVSLVIIAMLADVAASLARLAGSPPHGVITAAAVAATLAAGIIALLSTGTPLLVLALLVMAVVAGVFNGRWLTAVLRWEGRLEPRPAFLPRGLLGDGAVFSAADALLLAAPVVAVVLGAAG